MGVAVKLELRLCAIATLLNKHPPQLHKNSPKLYKLLATEVALPMGNIDL